MNKPITSVAEEALKAAGIDFRAPVNYRSVRLINKLFRAADDSKLWPINGAFNVTQRAIRWYARVYFRANGPCSNLEYIYGLEGQISRIVNSPDLY